MHLLILVVFASLLNLVSGCEEYAECTLPDGHVGLCYEKKCLRQVDEDPRKNLTLTIAVKYPETVLRNHGKTALYIRGNGLGLLWLKGKRLAKTGFDTWGINITYEASPTGYQCQTCFDDANLPNKKLEYRILADDLDDMLGANFAITFPVSQTSSYFGEKPTFTSYPWFFEKTGVITSYVLNSSYIGGERNITLYTPPSYNENTYKTYPTIFVFDLSLQLAKFFKRNFESPIYPHAVSEEYALIGFGDYKNDGLERGDLLTQDVSPFYFDCINGTFTDNCDGCIPAGITTNQTEFFRYLANGCGKKSIVGGLGDNTLDFLEKEALTFANKLASSRLRTDNLGVMGYSLGGLMSCYAIWTRPHVFSLAACQSPSFWWPYKDSSFDADFDFLNKTLKDPVFQTNRPEQKIYLDAGGAENLDPFRLTQSTVEAARIITSYKHYKLDKNVWVNVDPYKDHNFIEWAKRMGLALTTLLPAGGTTGMPSNEAAPVG
ncbi:uncharacterized protein LOC123561473 [Mercenaria mercenaria]|uniref:uncharacterized protein LOC123561473 n=1 Tax=Mercenaria mercenaria TaxID=6596 RepID=UPI001E1DEC84|nr:uncharacterized protein LOC123561473 [Mercenaria mercenaria]